MSKYSFPKEEKLKSSKAISYIFREGQNVFSYPLKFIFIITEQPEASNPKIAVSVSGKNFRKATERNLIKRRLRESYRLNKPFIAQTCIHSNLQLTGMFIFVGKEILSYNEITKGMLGVFSKLKKQFSQ